MSNSESQYSVRNEYNSYFEDLNDAKLKSYINERILGQIDWYDRKSIYNQKIYKRSMIISIILSALIPIVTIFADFPITLLSKIIIASLSSCVTVISAVNALCKYRDLWIQYRTNCEILKSVLHRYFTRSGEFGGQTEVASNLLLVDVCENYLSKEFQAWSTIIPQHQDRHL